MLERNAIDRTSTDIDLAFFPRESRSLSAASGRFAPETMLLVRMNPGARGSRGRISELSLAGLSIPVRSEIQGRSRFALIPLARAIEATEIPGSLHALTSFSLNSVLYRLRRLRCGHLISEVSTCPL